MLSLSDRLLYIAVASATVMGRKITFAPVKTGFSSIALALHHRLLQIRNWWISENTSTGT
jgi:hypothetical protein